MLNDIKIHGYCGKDPEKVTVQGVKGPYSKTTVSVGVQRDYGDGTDWFYCIFYGKKADVVEKWFRKGSQIIVMGRMESYKPKNDPNRTAWVLSAQDFDFCDRNDGSTGGHDMSGNGARTAQPEPAQGAQDGLGPLDEDDIPF